ncbi:MAG TPA: MarR family transcriptional regulator [Acidobacteriaceae bacterium]|nr:MarR family transcriptional regulator [Acidobacteriaceae bacterium]
MPTKPTAELRALAEQVEQHLAAIRKTIRQPLESEFARGHLTGPQSSLMEAVVRVPGGLTLKQIAAQLGLAHSTVSVMAARLVEKGLLTRQQHPTDGRATILIASPAVRSFLRNRMPSLTLSPLLTALSKASESDRRQILRALTKLRSLVETHSPRT